jgi:hypothetical protein
MWIVVVSPAMTCVVQDHEMTMLRSIIVMDKVQYCLVELKLRSSGSVVQCDNFRLVLHPLAEEFIQFLGLNSINTIRTNTRSKAGSYLFETSKICVEFSCPVYNEDCNMGVMTGYS